MEDVAIAAPEADEYAPFYHTYVSKVPSGPFLENLRKQGDALILQLEALEPKGWDFRYAEGKWSIKEVLQHIIDTERVMAYRLLRVSRGDQTPLPGFDQDDYIPAANSESRLPRDLMQEFQAVRESSLYLIGALTPSQLLLRGTASNHVISARALAYIIAGHVIHHQRILVEKYF